jgi:opine dehydrogenase
MRLTYSISRDAGMASAVTAALQGHSVRLHIAPGSDAALTGFLGQREIPINGYYGEHVVTFEAITDDLATVLDGAEVLVVIAETVGQRAVVSVAADRLSGQTTVLLAPGGVGGALEFSGRLRGTAAAGATIAETNGLMHLGAIFEAGRVTVKGIKRDLPLAFFPARADDRKRALLTELFPDLRPVENVLVTSLANTNTIVHGPVSIVNAGLIETRRGDFPFFTQAYSPGAGRLVDAVDAERVRLLEALGQPPVTGREWFQRFYGDQGMAGETLQQMLSTFGAFQRSASPSSLDHPYFSEDVPFGLVPLASLSRRFGVAAPATEAVITLCSIVCNLDFWAHGRTVESLGIADYSVDDLRRLVDEGWPER